MCVYVNPSLPIYTNSLRPHELYSPWNSPGQSAQVGSHFLLKGIFPIWGSNPGLPHCRRILYQLSHKGNPRILEWVAYPFSSNLPHPGIKLGPPALQVGSLPAEPPTKPKKTGVGLFLLQGIFPSQESNWGLLHCRWILCQPSYQERPTFPNSPIKTINLFSTSITLLLFCK